MGDEELRRRMAALFAEYGGPLAPFMEAVVAWAETTDFGKSLPEYGIRQTDTHYGSRRGVGRDD